MKLIMQLDPSLRQWVRRPRSKKRRIRRKWCNRPANWRPNPNLIGCFLTGGALSGVPPLQYDADGNMVPTSYKMHPATWASLLASRPDLADQFEIVPLQ